MSDSKPENKVEFGASAKVNVDLTDSANALLKPAASVIGRFFEARLYNKHGQFIKEQEINALNDAYDIEKHKQLKEAQLIAETHFENIKDSNLKIPLSSDVIPPVDALDIYFDKEHYRDMYARLIAMSMDQSKSGHNIPAYTAIIKELSELDYEVIKFLYENNVYWKELQCLYTFHFNYIVNHKFASLKMINYEYSYDEGITALEVSSSIDNLIRLGLIELETIVDLSPKEGLPDPIKDNVEIKIMYKEFLKDKRSKEFIPSIHRHSIFFTSLGEKFTMVMLDRPSRYATFGE